MRAIESAEAALEAAGLDGVSRETIDRLDAFVALLRQWSRVQNLVGPSALREIWTRHVADSAQLVALAPQCQRWIDIGSGAGLPGIITGILLAETDGASVQLVESNARKSAFLREAARITGAPINVHQIRIERFVSNWTEPFDAISARAVAPTATLLDWVEPMLRAGAPAYLHKGLDFDAEWAAVTDQARYHLIQHPNRIGSGVIAELQLRSDGDQSES